MIWTLAALWSASFLVGIGILKKMNGNSEETKEPLSVKLAETILKASEEDAEDFESQRKEREKIEWESYNTTMQKILKLEVEALMREKERRDNDSDSYIHISIDSNGRPSFVPSSYSHFSKR
jgi:hypothetical protein